MEAAPPGFMVKRGARGKAPTDVERAPSLSSPTAGSVLATAASSGSATLTDTPYGFDRLPPITTSVAAFQRRCEWFYVDPSGEEHGPVPLQKIINWHRKGHFPDDVKVRCRSPWFGVGALIKSLDDSQELDTPTAAAQGRGSWSTDGLNPAGSVGAAAAVPPPPPPPRQGSISGFGAAGLGSYDAELNALFGGNAAWGEEPVWYYIDRSDQVQGPFSAREMVGWVSTSMLKEDTKMCAADAKLGIPPGRNLYQPLSELLTIIRHGDRYLPANMEHLRRKPSITSAAAVVPPPPPPPRRADSIGDGFGASAFGPPGRASDAPTWRKDIPAPGTSGGNNMAAPAGGGGSSTDGGGAATGASSGRGSSESGAAAPGASMDGSAAIAAALAAAAAAAAGGPPGVAKDTADVQSSASDPGMTATRGSEDGNRASRYHNSNAEALSAALAPDQDFEYGEDFKRQRQVQREAAQAAAAVGQAQGRNPAGTRGLPGMQPQPARVHSDQLGLGFSASGPGSAGNADPGSASAQAVPVSQQLMHQAAAAGITPEMIQQILQQQQQHAAQQKAQQAAIAAGIPGMMPAGMHGMMLNAGVGGPQMVPASAPIAMATAAGGSAGFQALPGVAAGIMNMSLQQQQQARQQQMMQGQMPMLVSMPMSAAQQQQAQQSQQQQPQVITGLPGGIPLQQLQQLLQSGQQQQVMAYMQQQQQQQAAQQQQHIAQQQQAVQQQQQAQAQQQQQAGAAAGAGHVSASQQLVAMQQAQQQAQQQQPMASQQHQQLQQLQAALQSGRLVAMQSGAQGGNMAAVAAAAAANMANAGMLVGQGSGMLNLQGGQQQQQAQPQQGQRQ